MAKQCEMIIGFLVPHRCDHAALGQCTKCSREYCEEHIEVTPTGLICQACSQGLEQPVALPVTARTFTVDDLAAFNAASQWDTDDDEMFSDLS